MISKALQKHLQLFFEEDDLLRNFAYTQNLPTESVQCSLKIKDDLVLAGLPFFFETFNYLLNGSLHYEEYLKDEGHYFSKEDFHEIHFSLPFNIVLTGERIALNLLQKTSAIATHTSKIVNLVQGSGVAILDTRKTTPGHRYLEKYAVKVGGGYNHRFGQLDAFMIKDNHKSFFGGLEEALKYFKELHSFYTPIVVEIHSLDEMKEAIDLGVEHVMLDNFSPEKILKAIELKGPEMTIEVSGGITVGNLKSYLVDGIDAISMGSLTYNAPHVDLSLKYSKGH